MIHHNKKSCRAAVFALVGGLALSLAVVSPVKADSKGQCGVSQELVIQVRGMAAYAKRYMTNAGKIVDPAEVLAAAQREKVLGADDTDVQSLFAAVAFKGVLAEYKLGAVAAVTSHAWSGGSPVPPPNPEDLAASEYWDTGAQPHTNPETNTTAAHHAAPEGDLTINKAIQNYNLLNVEKTVR